MAAATSLTEAVLYDTLVNYLISMARTVESAMNRALDAMVSRSLGALIFRNADMAALVLESDDVVDKFRDTIFEKLLANMTEQAALVSPGLQFVLATRHLERIADHATNIAEDIIFWVRGLDVRHGRGLTKRPDRSEGQANSGIASEPPGESPVAGSPQAAAVIENSHAVDAGVTLACDTERA